MRCLSMLLMYWPCITLFSHFSFKDSANLAFVSCHSSRLIDLIHLCSSLLL
jgi:hypothetical protein